MLQQTIAEAALDEEARRLGLGQSDDETMRMILSDPNFKGTDGAFDPARFQAAIRQFGYSEQRYVADQRRVSLRRQIAGSISAGLEPPKVMIEALSRFQNERRSIDYVKLEAAQAGTIEPPSPETLAGLFRRAQDPVPCARISQNRLCRDYPGSDRKMDRGLGCRCKEAVRAAPRPARHARKTRGLANRVSKHGRGDDGAQPYRFRNLVRRSGEGARIEARRR